MTPVVSIIMGSTSDLPVMEKAGGPAPVPVFAKAGGELRGQPSKSKPKPGGKRKAV